MIKEECKVPLLTTFYLANERKNLNVNLIKEYLFYVKYKIFYQSVVKENVLWLGFKRPSTYRG